MQAWIIRAALSTCLLAALAGHAPASADDRDRAQTFQEVIGEAQATADRISSLRPHVDDSEFDIMPAVERFDFDAEQIGRFVTENVRYEPYDGVLRGAQATLSARAGNAIDQSLLLIALLEMAGYDAQILRIGEADSELAGLLADAAMRPRPTAPAIADMQALEAALAEALGSRADEAGAGSIARSLGPREPAALDSAVVEAAGRLTELVRAGRTEISADNYYWVRYRLGPGMSWTHLHPALAGAEPEGLEPDEVLTGSASDDMLHFIEIGLEAEILENGRLRKVPLMSPWRQPVAALFDRPISVSLFGDIDRASESQTGIIFMPSLNDETPPGAQGVTLRGAVIDAGIMDMDSQGMSGVFSTLGDVLQDAGDLVGGGPEDQPARALTGIILTISWTRPSGETRTDERWLIDRLANRHASGDAPRLNLDMTNRWLAHRMNFHRDILVSAGGAHDAHRLAASLDAEALGLRYGAHLLELADPDSGEIDVNRAQPLIGSHAPFLLSLQNVIDQEISSQENHHVYRDGPAVVSLHRAWDPGHSEGVAYIDILMNPWAAAARQDGRLVTWPEGALARGVLDTQIEVDFGSGEAGSDYFGALSRMPGLMIAREAGDIADLPQDARLAAEADLAEGFMLAMLEPSDPAGSPLWWRVRPDGGEVLGRNALGGQSTAEYIVTYTSGAWALYSFANDTKSCVDGYDAGNGLGCCLTYTLVYHGGTATIGAGVSAGMRAGAARTAGNINEVTHLGALDLVTAIGVETGLNIGGYAGSELLPDLTREGKCGGPTRP